MMLEPHGTGAPETRAPALVVEDAGPLTLIEDLGRSGYASIGVSGSGALDRGALRLANRLVGNPESAAGLEILAGGFIARFTAATWFAVTGASGRLHLGETEFDQGEAVLAHPGTVLRIGQAEAGIRFYLAVRGGIDVPGVLGSRSRDTLAALGPAPVSPGDRLPVGEPPADEIPAADVLGLRRPDGQRVTVLLHSGPRADWLTPAGEAALFEQEWMLSARSDRIGARLEGVPLERVDARARRELPSEPMVAGAIQLPPSGLPTVLLADHPVTGGYPVVAVVADASLDLFAQLRPGQAIAFRHA